MTEGMTPENRQSLIDALNRLASEIEANPPPIVGTDVFVQAGAGTNVIGTSTTVMAGSGTGSATGNRVVVVADKPGQTVIGSRTVVVLGGPAMAPPASGAASQEELTGTVDQLREAAKSLESSPASAGWIKGTLATVSSWGSSALSGAMSGVSNAVVRFYMTGT